MNILPRSLLQTKCYKKKKYKSVHYASLKIPYCGQGVRDLALRGIYVLQNLNSDLYIQYTYFIGISGFIFISI